MEEGALRVDANVSVRRVGEPLSTRTEIKNIGSIRGVAAAVKHEIARQLSVVGNGGRVESETRSWDSMARVTVPMRDKEVVQDYRYMPEPNLPPLRVNLHTLDDTQDVISVNAIKNSIPPLPEDSRRILIEEHQLRLEAAIQLVNEPILLDYFHELTSETSRNPTKVANLLLNDLLTVLNKRRINVEDCPITVNQIMELTDLLHKKGINLDVCKMVLDELATTPDSNVAPSTIIKQKGWSMVTDEKEINNLCNQILENNPNLVKQYKAGKVKVFQALLGILAKNPQKVDMKIASKTMEGLLKK